MNKEKRFNVVLEEVKIARLQYWEKFVEKYSIEDDEDVIDMETLELTNKKPRMIKEFGSLTTYKFAWNEDELKCLFKVDEFATEKCTSDIEEIISEDENSVCLENKSLCSQFNISDIKASSGQDVHRTSFNNKSSINLDVGDSGYFSSSEISMTSLQFVEDFISKPGISTLNEQDKESSSRLKKKISQLNICNLNLQESQKIEQEKNKSKNNVITSPLTVNFNIPIDDLSLSKSRINWRKQGKTRYNLHSTQCANLNDSSHIINQYQFLVIDDLCHSFKKHDPFRAKILKNTQDHSKVKHAKIPEMKSCSIVLEKLPDNINEVISLKTSDNKKENSQEPDNNKKGCIRILRSSKISFKTSLHNYKQKYCKSIPKKQTRKNGISSQNNNDVINQKCLFSTKHELLKKIPISYLSSENCNENCFKEPKIFSCLSESSSNALNNTCFKDDNNVVNLNNSKETVIQSPVKSCNNDYNNKNMYNPDISENVEEAEKTLSNYPKVLLTRSSTKHILHYQNMQKGDNSSILNNAIIPKTSSNDYKININRTNESDLKNSPNSILHKNDIFSLKEIKVLLTDFKTDKLDNKYLINTLVKSDYNIQCNSRIKKYRNKLSTSFKCVSKKPNNKRKYSRKYREKKNQKYENAVTSGGNFTANEFKNEVITCCTLSFSEKSEKEKHKDKTLNQHKISFVSKKKNNSIKNNVTKQPEQLQDKFDLSKLPIDDLALEAKGESHSNYHSSFIKSCIPNSFAFNENYKPLQKKRKLSAIVDIPVSHQRNCCKFF